MGVLRSVPSGVGAVQEGMDMDMDMRMCMGGEFWLKGW